MSQLIRYCRAWVPSNKPLNYARVFSACVYINNTEVLQPSSQFRLLIWSFYPTNETRYFSIRFHVTGLITNRTWTLLATVVYVLWQTVSDKLQATKDKSHDSQGYFRNYKFCFKYNHVMALILFVLYCLLYCIQHVCKSSMFPFFTFNGLEFPHICSFFIGVC